MTPEEERLYTSAERAASAERTELLKTTQAELFALFKIARDRAVAAIAAGPTEYEQWRMGVLIAEIDRVAADLSASGTRVIGRAADRAWQGGVAALDEPMAAIGLRSAIPRLDTGQLQAMRAFMVDRIANISTTAAATIRGQIGLAMMGTISIREAISGTAKALGETAENRATTIVVTELGRVWSVASDERAAEFSAAGVPMDKIWRRSGKVHSRPAHDLADGQRQPIDKPFMVAGQPIKFPRDPAAPVGQTINCGCIALYRPRNTPGTLPDKRPFTPSELSANPFKAELAALNNKS